MTAFALVIWHSLDHMSVVGMFRLLQLGINTSRVEHIIMGIIFIIIQLEWVI